MLFDLRATGRRRFIKAIYLFLAILIGGGLIFFGVGGSGIGLFNADQNSGGGGGGSSFADQAKKLEKQAQRQPRDASTQLALARVEYQLAGGSNYDQQTGVFTADGKKELAKAAAAWEAYMALNPPRPDSNVARLMAQTYGPGGLNQPAKAAQALEIVATATPIAATYAQLALFSYAAGETRKGDLASAKALELAPASQRALLRAQLKQAKKQGPNALGGGQPPPASG